MAATANIPGLVERLAKGDHVLIAEGYVFELEKRGYLKAGAYVPEVVLEHPECVKTLHREFVHAGSEVVEALTYYAFRSKLEQIGRADDLEILNRTALKMAREIADETGTLMAGNLSNTNVWQPDNVEAQEMVEAMFKEQILWAKEEGADYIIAETFPDLDEALLAAECIDKYAPDLPAVVTLSHAYRDHCSFQGRSIGAACRDLEEAGAAVVGLNCTRGPESMLPAMRDIRACCKGPIACLPVPYRTDDKNPRFQDLHDVKTGIESFPTNLSPWYCSKQDIEDFTKEAMQIGIQYLGICCGNQSFYLRAMAETLGKKPPACKYSTDMSQHVSRLKDAKYAGVQETYNKNYERTNNYQ